MLITAFTKFDDEVYCGPPLSEPSLLPRKKRVDNGLDAGVNEPLEDLVRDTEQRDGAIALGVLYRFHWCGDHDNQRSSPNFSNFEVVQTG